jgi:hypothetical protein
MKTLSILIFILAFSLSIFGQASSVYPVLGSTNKNDVSDIVNDSLDAIRDSSILNSTGYYLTNYSTVNDTLKAVSEQMSNSTLVLNKIGIWNIRGYIHLSEVGATFAAEQTITVKLRRINNTATDLLNGTRTYVTNIVTTVTQDLGYIPIDIYYTTNIITEEIQLYGVISATPSAGIVLVRNANIIARWVSY